MLIENRKSGFRFETENRFSILKTGFENLFFLNHFPIENCIMLKEIPEKINSCICLLFMNCNYWKSKYNLKLEISIQQPLLIYSDLLRPWTAL